MGLLRKPIKTWLKSCRHGQRPQPHDAFNPDISGEVKPEHFAEFLTRVTDLIRENISGGDCGLC